MGTVQLEDYFQSAFRNKFLVKMPERDEKHVSPATRLLEKRRETAEVEHALAAQKEEFSMKMEGLHQRRQELESKEQELKQSLMKFDRFLRENDSKKNRALKKAKDERNMIKLKEVEIQNLQEECYDLEMERDKFKKRLEKYTIYQTYLEKVLDQSDEFSELREIMARYDTLISTHNDLLSREQKNQITMEKEKQKFNRFTEEKNNEILHYNNQLAQLQTRLDKAQSEAVHWESKWTHIQNTAARKTLLLGQIKIATHNLYQLVQRHARNTRSGEGEIDDDEENDQNQNNTSKNSKDLSSSGKRSTSASASAAAGSTEETARQLDRIQSFIQDLTQIASDIRKQENLAVV